MIQLIKNNDDYYLSSQNIPMELKSNKFKKFEF